MNKLEVMLKNGYGFIIDNPKIIELLSSTLKDTVIRDVPFIVLDEDSKEIIFYIRLADISLIRKPI